MMEQEKVAAQSQQNNDGAATAKYREFGPVIDEHGNRVDPESSKYRDKVLDEMLVT